MIHIQLAPEVEAQLAAEAQARGLALERYIADKLSESASPEHSQQRSVSDAIDTIHKLRKGNLLGDIRIKDLIRDGRKH